MKVLKRFSEIPPINIELLFLEGQEHPNLIGNIISMCSIDENITPILNQVYCTTIYSDLLRLSAVITNCMNHNFNKFHFISSFDNSLLFTA